MTSQPHIGDFVKFTPPQGYFMQITNGDPRFVEGKVYEVARVVGGIYLVLVGLEDLPGGGIHKNCFTLVNSKSDV